MKITNIAFPLSFCLLLLIACQKIDNTQANSDDQHQFYVADISSETDADVAIICEDGTFIVYDRENELNHEIVYLNKVEEDNSLNNSLTIVLDSNHLPLYASFEGKTAYFAHFVGNTFDCAVVDTDGSITYYWDLETDIDVNNLLGSLPVETKVSDSVKITLSAVTKLAVFGVIATGMVFGSPVVAGSMALAFMFTFVSESLKSADATGYLPGGNYGAYFTDGLGYFVEYADKGKISPTTIGMAIAIGGADYLLNSVGQNKEEIENNFATEDWQIKLSTYNVYCSPESKTYNVHVTSKAYWSFEIPSGQNRFCDISKEGDNLVIKAQKYDGTQDREMTVFIKSNDQTGSIQPAKLTVIQNGFLFELSEEKLTFTQEGGNKGVYINKNDQISSWELSYPKDFCKVTQEKSSFFVTVDKYEIENRYGTITVIGYVKNSSLFVERKLPVEQIIETWDGTQWNCKGNLSISASSDFSYTGALDDFTISIQDAKSGKFSSSIPWNSMQLLDDGNLKFKFHYTYSHSEKIEGETFSVSVVEDGEMILKRTGVTTAKGDFSGSGHYDVCGDKTDATFNGKIDATLTGSTKASNVRIEPKQWLLLRKE